MQKHNQELLDTITAHIKAIDVLETQMDEDTHSTFRDQYDMITGPHMRYFDLLQREAEALIKHGTLKIKPEQLLRFNNRYDIVKTFVGAEREERSDAIQPELNGVGELELTDPKEEYIYADETMDIYNIIEKSDPDEYVSEFMTRTELLVFINEL